MPKFCPLLAALGVLTLLSPAAAQTVGRSVIQHDVTAALAGLADAKAGAEAAQGQMDYAAGPWIGRLLAEWPGLPREARNQRRLPTVKLLASSGRVEAAEALAGESPTYPQRIEAFEQVFQALLERGDWDAASEFVRRCEADFQGARQAGKLELLAAWVRDALARCGQLEACAELQERLARDFGPRLLDALTPLEQRYLFALEAALNGRRPEAERAWYDLRREGLAGTRAWKLSRRLCLAAVRAGDVAGARAHWAALQTLPAGSQDGHSLEIELGFLQFDLADGDEIRALERAREALARFDSPAGLLATGQHACRSGRLDLAEECRRALLAGVRHAERQALEVEILRSLFAAGNIQEALARISSEANWQRQPALELAQLLAEHDHGEMALNLAGSDRALGQAIELQLGMQRGARGDSAARLQALARADEAMDRSSLYPRVELLSAYDQIGAGHEGALETELLLRVAAGQMSGPSAEVDRVLSLDLDRQEGFGLRRLLAGLGDGTQRFDLCLRAAGLCVERSPAQP
jgi:hypothetical protein